MGSFFSPDSKFMQTMSRLADLVVLNLLFLVSCVPLFTIGAASTAMYTVCFQLGTEKESGIFRTYFRSFRENFKQSTILFLILALLPACAKIRKEDKTNPYNFSSNSICF